MSSVVRELNDSKLKRNEKPTFIFEDGIFGVHEREHRTAVSGACLLVWDRTVQVVQVCLLLNDSKAHECSILQRGVYRPVAIRIDRHLCRACELRLLH